MRFTRPKTALRFLGFTMKRLIALLAFCTPAFAVLAEPQVPEGWRLPNAHDMKGSWGEFRKELPTPYFVRADFNRDQKPDEAWILLRKEGEAWALFVFLSTPSGRFDTIKLEEGKDYAHNQGVSLAGSGTYQTACAKGYGLPCGPDEPRSVEIRGPAFNFFTFESSSSVVYWDESARQLKQIWLSD